MALRNVVRNGSGTELAAFLSSLDARKWAEREGGGCEVEDWGLTVTRHERLQPMLIIARGSSDSYNHVRKNFPNALDAGPAEQVSA